MKIEFFVAGEPRPKQSFRMGGGGGFTPARVKAWQQEVAWAALCAMRMLDLWAPLSWPDLEVWLEFRLGDARRVDLDNLSKAVLDGCNKICWDDDQQVTVLHLRKTVDTRADNRLPGVTVRVEKANWSELVQSLVASIAPAGQSVRS